LLTLATGTGKTFIAFQVAWKLFQSRWNLQRDGSRRPRILFLADRNVLANQAYNGFEPFGEDGARRRIKPNEIRAAGQVPTNASIFFTIFQTFMSGPPSVHDGIEALGDVSQIRSAFIGFQKHLYRKENA
jgi:type I restriction enzyme, R subunit